MMAVLVCSDRSRVGGKQAVDMETDVGAVFDLTVTHYAFVAKVKFFEHISTKLNAIFYHGFDAMDVFIFK
jgi:hypothetical protein